MKEQSNEGFSDMLKVIKHEVAHIVFDSLGNPDGVPIGISEGIAVSIAGQVEPDFLIDNESPSIIERISVQWV